MYSPTAVPDLAALRQCWHPVGYSSKLTNEPRRAQLLGELIVLWRDSSGKAHALADMCIHRGTALSIGWVTGDEIVCPYHGWRFASSGACTLIPQLEDPTRIPSKARVNAYQCKERYGLLWVSLDDPRWPLPEIPEFESAEFQLVSTGPYEWRADASRQLENFTDFGHFAWVHPGILGDPNRPVVPKHTVEAKGHVIHYEVVRPEAQRNDKFPIFFNESQTGFRHACYGMPRATFRTGMPQCRRLQGRRRTARPRAGPVTGKTLNAAGRDGMVSRPFQASGPSATLGRR